MKRSFAPTAALALALVAAPAAAGPSRGTPGSSYGTSCIDANNNGACGDAGDLPLGQAVDAGGMYLDSQHGSHSGLVLQGDVSLPAFLYVQVTNDIVVSGSVTESGDEVGATLQTVRGNITIAPHSSITATNSLTFETVGARSTFDIGPGTSARVSGDSVDLQFKASGSLHVGANQTYTVSGGGYANLWLDGANGLQVDPGQKFTASNHGGIIMNAGSDLTLANVSWKAGYISIDAFGSDAHPGARHVVITDSTLGQTYRNGAFQIYADTPALGSVLVDHSKIVARNPYGGIVNPLATCIASTAPAWVCQ